jgi:hypothetical protein
MTPGRQWCPLNVLLVGTNQWSLDAAVGALVAAGHRVLRCTESDEPSFPCKGLRVPGTCPVEVGVDVVVTVRAQPRARVTEREFGVICARREGVPLVVAGRTLFHPFDDLAPEVLQGAGALDELAHACERAAERLRV